MKKTLVFCGVLCATLLLFCGTALAADVQVTTTTSSVQVTTIDKNGDTAFQISQDGASKERLYLIMIQEGSDANENPKPTKDNLYYLNVEEGAETWEAYPKDLAQDGSYILYLSDYSDASNGAAKGVAIISTKSAGGDTPGDDTPTPGDDTPTPGGDTPTPGDDTPTPGGDTPGAIVYGDVNGDGDVKRNDRIILAHYLAEKNDPDSQYGPGKRFNVVLANADVNGDGEVKRNDRIILTRYLAHMPGYETLPPSSAN